MAEELYPITIEMDTETWEAIQRGKDLTREFNGPLSKEEVTIVQGPVDLKALDEPEFGPQSTEPQAIASNKEEFEEMRASWEMGQTLEGMILGGEGKGWKDLRHIASEKVKELRQDQDNSTGVNRDEIVTRALRLRYFREAYDFLFNTVTELIKLPRPVLLQKQEEK